MPGEKFDKLAKHIAHEYVEKGVSKAKALEYGYGTAAKIYRIKQSKKRGHK